MSPAPRPGQPAPDRRRQRRGSLDSSRLRVVAVGRKLAPHEDMYHFVLTLSWPRFFAALAAGFVAVNTLFAALYSLSPGCIVGASKLEDLFFFSVQTLATIGYGAMAPQTRWGHVVVSAEALTGIVSTALITGFTFARFARPTARILFSERAVITPRNGIPHLVFRVANWRRNQIVEAQIHVIVLATETTREGETIRRPTTLKLVRQMNAMFALTWTVMHPIDEDSPFYGPGALERLRATNTEIFVGLNGLDETLAQTIHARYRYALDDIVPNARFVDVLTQLEDGTRVIDYDKFHDVIPIETTTAVAAE